MCFTKWSNESPLKLVKKRLYFQTDKPELHLACLGKSPFENLGYEKRSQGSSTLHVKLERSIHFFFVNPIYFLSFPKQKN